MTDVTGVTIRPMRRAIFRMGKTAFRPLPKKLPQAPPPVAIYIDRYFFRHAAGTNSSSIGYISSRPSSIPAHKNSLMTGEYGE